MSRTILETERLRLREFEPKDAPAVREMLADEDALRFYGRLVAEPGYAERWIERNLQRYREDGFGLWALETLTNGDFVGDCGLSWQTLEKRRLLEIGYHLTESARGHGYATEAANACLGYAFETLEVETVCSIVDVENTASRGVAERIHARFEEGFEKGGRPMVLYSTTRSDFAGV